MTRDRLDDAFLRLRDAADADEYVPMEDVIEVVLARLARAEKENRWEAYAAFGSNYKDATAEVIALREERDEALRLLATRVEAKRLDEAQEEIARLRAKVRTITEQYKPGWVDGLHAVARSAGYDPDKLRHEGVDPPTFIEDVIDLLRRDVRDLKAENESLREACTLALRIMEQTNRVTVPPFAKFITLDFAPEDIAVLRAALEKKP